MADEEKPKKKLMKTWDGRLRIEATQNSKKQWILDITKRLPTIDSKSNLEYEFTPEEEAQLMKDIGDLGRWRAFKELKQDLDKK